MLLGKALKAQLFPMGTPLVSYETMTLGRQREGAQSQNHSDLSQQILYLESTAHLLTLHPSRTRPMVLQNEVCSDNKTPSIAQKNHNF